MISIVGNIILWVIVVLMFIVIAIAFTRKRYYMVYTASADPADAKLMLCRNLWEWEVAGTAVFRDEDNRRVILSKHWILKIVELKRDDVELEWAKREKEQWLKK